MLEQLAEATPDRVNEALRGSLHLRRLVHSGETDVRPVADPALLQLELFDEVIRLFSGLASAGCPLALLFDDVHAADEASVLFLHHLCRKLADAATPAIVIATYRPEEAAAAANRSLTRLLSSLRRDRLMRELAL